jgi:DNA polymerase III subunit gamma/tau
MSYQVLSRKWRPQVFDDVIGQLHITQTLKNAIQKERVAHGFLFSGLRGVGKTTTARIFSKALNCSNPQNNNPCNKCNICKDITSGRSLDVLEIDGASNRGIDEIRELREAVKYPPSNGKYRIYIIDEVHMLTTHAFNALLKTLEEPPSHVKFILATTDPQKLPQTILSRTLRFEFKRVQLPILKNYIQYILDEEKIKYDDASLIQIAKKGDGSVRDSLSLLDQAIAYTNGNLTLNEVQNILGVISESLYCEVLSDIITKNRDLISNVHKALNSGISLGDFIIGLNHFLNQTMLVLSEVDIDIELGEDTIKWIQSQPNLQVLDVLRMIELSQNFESKLRHMKYPILNMDSLLVKFLSMESTVTISEIIHGNIKNIPPNPFPQKNNEVKPVIKYENKTKNDDKIKNVSLKIVIPDKNEKPLGKISEKTPIIELNPIKTHGSKLDLNFFERNWNDFLDQLESENPKYLTYLADVKLKSFINGTLTIQLNSEDAFNAKGINNNKLKLEEILEIYSGEKVKLSLNIIKENLKPTVEKIANGIVNKSNGHPLFETIMETFDGELMRS